MRLAAAFLFLLITVASHAATARAEGPSLIVNEVRVLTFRTAMGEASPTVRARALASLLDGQESLSLGIQHAPATSKLYAGEQVIVVVNKAEAKRHGSSPTALASAWAKSLRNAWDLPPVKLNRTSVFLPLGKSATVEVIGSEARTAEMQASNQDVARISRAGAKVTIKAGALGESTVTVGGQPIVVRVLPYAASFPQNLTVNVVGSPAAGPTVQAAIEGALKTRLRTSKDATTSWKAVKAGDIPTGEKRTYTVKVQADSPNAFKSEGTVNLTVANIAIALKRESELWYCNEPENVKRPQSLFLASLRRDDPVRMLYHHINDSHQGLFFRVMAVNDSDQPASVVILPGDSKDKNPVLAGVLAADPFFRSRMTGSGEVVSIPPRSSLPIAFRRLAPQETSSGLCYLRLLPGGPERLSVSAEAVLPFDLNERWQAAQRTQTPWREIGVVADYEPAYPSENSNLIFPNPFKNAEFSYLAGGKYAFFRIGQVPIERRDPGKPLDGNFGVTYSIEAKAENPTSSPAEVELVFETSAGYSGAIFSIDGQVVRLPLMQAKAEARLVRFTLQPGESRSINVTTIPLSGSSYPVTLVMRPISTLPDLVIKG